VVLEDTFMNAYSFRTSMAHALTPSSPADAARRRQADPMAAEYAKDRATAYRMQNYKPYDLGNAFAHYGAAGN
jgi:hypothetical protein